MYYDIRTSRCAVLLATLSLLFTSGCGKNENSSAPSTTPSAAPSTGEQAAAPPAAKPKARPAPKLTPYTTKDMEACSDFRDSTFSFCMRMRGAAADVTRCGEETESRSEARDCLRKVTRRGPPVGDHDASKCDEFDDDLAALCRSQKVPSDVVDWCYDLNNHWDLQYCFGVDIIDDPATDKTTASAACDAEAAHSVASKASSSFGDDKARVAAMQKLVAMNCDAATEALGTMAKNSLTKVPIRILAASHLGMIPSNLAADLLYEAAKSTLNKDEARLAAVVALQAHAAKAKVLGGETKPRAVHYLQAIKKSSFSTDAMKTAADVRSN